MSRVAFVLSQFPEMHETFILREFLEFDRRGIAFDIYSLKSCRDPIVHPEVEQLMDRVHYSPFLWSRQLLVAQWRTLTRRPRAYFTALASLFRDYWRQPVTLIKTLAAYPKIVRFAESCRQTGVTHIHAHWATIPTTAAGLLARLTGLPFSFTAHAWDIHVPNSSLPQKLQQARFVVTCTGHNQEFLESLRPDETSAPIVLNYHGIDLEQFALGDPARHSRRRIFSIGRMVEQKGFEFLVRALRLVRDRDYDIACTIIGQGPGKAALEALVDELDLAETVEILGPQSQDSIRERYHRSCMFVLPCVIASNGDRDGIPNVIVEAMAMGLPVLSSRVSGVPELVEHEVTGLLAEPKDVAAIADGIVRLLEDQELWEGVRHRGRKRVQQMFDVTQNVGELIDCFRRHGAVE